MLLHFVLRAQPFDARHQRDITSNPGGLHFRLGITGGATSFHRGERIPLTLEFWSDTPEKYKLNSAAYDRSGRLPVEEFVLDRMDAPDPYADYFGSAVLGGLAGGIRGYPALESKPVAIALDLNDWFRFDVPGRYRLYLKSHRIERERVAGETGSGRTVRFAAVSNLVEFTIVPDDAAWIESKLRSIETVLAKPEPEWPALNPLDEQFHSARRDLRFLATDGAVDLAFRDARKRGASPDTLLLIGVRDRAHAVAAYDRYLADRTTPIRQWDIRLRALFTYLEKDSPAPMPTHMWEMPKDSSGWDRLRARVEERQKRFDTFVRGEAIRLIPVTIAKEGPARKVSAEAIAGIAPDEARAALLVPADDYGLSRDELIAQFVAFSEERQSELLGKKWDLVRDARMIGPLRTVIGRTSPGGAPKNAIALHAWGSGVGLGESALRRLNEIAPEEVYRTVAADLASGKPRFAGFAFREISERDIPEADAVFSKWLAAGETGALPLIGKFGTAKFAGEMRERYLSKSWPCAEELSFLTYFVRKLPPQGPGSAGDLLKHSLANRENRGCHHFLLEQLSHVVWSPVLETEAIHSLGDPDAETVASAAKALGSQGSAAAETFLWKRLEKWTETWRGRTSEFDVHPITGGVPSPESRLGTVLMDAIAGAKSWSMDDSRRELMLGLCLDEHCRQEWTPTRRPVPIKIDVSQGGGLYPAAFRVDRYTAPNLDTLENKLAQYPAGTSFRWCPQVSNPFDGFTSGQREEMYQRLKPVLARRSLTIEPYSEEKCR